MCLNCCIEQAISCKNVKTFDPEFFNLFFHIIREKNRNIKIKKIVKLAHTSLCVFPFFRLRKRSWAKYLNILPKCDQFPATNLNNRSNWPEWRNSMGWDQEVGLSFILEKKSRQYNHFMFELSESHKASNLAFQKVKSKAMHKRKPKWFRQNFRSFPSVTEIGLTYFSQPFSALEIPAVLLRKMNHKNSDLKVDLEVDLASPFLYSWSAVEPALDFKFLESWSRSLTRVPYFSMTFVCIFCFKYSCPFFISWVCLPLLNVMTLY